MPAVPFDERAASADERLAASARKMVRLGWRASGVGDQPLMRDRLLRRLLVRAGDVILRHARRVPRILQLRSCIAVAGAAAEGRVAGACRVTRVGALSVNDQLLAVRAWL